MENMQIDLAEYLGKLRVSESAFEPLTGQSFNEEVTSRVFDNLLILIPSGTRVDQASANVFGFAVRQLCLAKTSSEIDWLRLVSLSADVCRLWNSNWTRKS